MKATSNFRSEPAKSAYPMLPKGLYIAQIKGVKVEEEGPDQRMTIRLDIAEGEYAGYYTKRYKADQERGGQFEIKYKGDFVLYAIDEKNTARKFPQSDIKKFNGSMWAIEQSNPGYRWEWDERTLAGKLVGINVRQGTFNGIEYTNIGRLESIPDIKAGKVKVMKDAEPRGSESTTEAAGDGLNMVVDEDVPF